MVRKGDIYAFLVGFAFIFFIGTYFASKSFFPSLYGGLFSSDGAPLSTDDTKKDYPHLQSIDPASLSQKISNGDSIRIIDLRPEEAYRREHINGSQNLTLSSLTSDTDILSVLVIATNDVLTSETIENIMSKHPGSFVLLDGGIEAWKSAHYPIISIGDPKSFSDQSKVLYISPEELRKTLEISNDTIFLIDVQNESAFRERHISGAMNLPLDRIEMEIEKIKPPIARTVVVYGSNDLESFQAGVRISDLGAFPVKTLSGNDHLMSKSGLPLDSSR